MSAKNHQRGGFQCFGECPKCGIFGAALIHKVIQPGYMKDGKIVQQWIDRKCRECDHIWLQLD